MLKRVVCAFPLLSFFLDSAPTLYAWVLGLVRLMLYFWRVRSILFHYFENCKII